MECKLLTPMSMLISVCNIYIDTNLTETASFKKKWWKTSQNSETEIQHEVGEVQFIKILSCIFCSLYRNKATIEEQHFPAFFFKTPMHTLKPNA